MRKRLLSILALLAIGCSVIFSTHIVAQVTFGSQQIPVSGALLDFKNIIPTAEQPLVNSTKGLILPRVELTKLDELFPMLDGNESDYELQKQLHIGLLVYNVNATTAPFNQPEYGIGKYVWNGREWDKIMNQDTSIGSNNLSLMPSPTMYSNADMYEPNSYIVKPGVMSSPIKLSKMYAMWEHYRIPANARVGANKTLSEFAGKTLGETVSIRLIWQDNPNLFGISSLTQTGAGRTGSFAVRSNSGQTGNAVFGAYINNEIYWSWHIWVTDYNPLTSNHILLNTTQKNTLVFMDRNLGARDAALGKVSSMGLLYQWGRKDPFPTASDVMSATPAPLYGTSGIVALPTTETVSSNLNLVASISNPARFYKFATTPASGTTNTFDWYSNLGYTASTGDRAAIMNDQLWDENNRKTPFDPCPRGWKVPNLNNDISDWVYIPAKSIEPKEYGSTTDFDAVYGLNFVNKTDYQIGAYPASGIIKGENFSYHKVGEIGNYWSAQPSTDNIKYSSSLRFNGRSLHGREPLYRAEGASVRCVKE